MGAAVARDADERHPHLYRPTLKVRDEVNSSNRSCKSRTDPLSTRYAAVLVGIARTLRTWISRILTSTAGGRPTDVTWSDEAVAIAVAQVNGWLRPAVPSEYPLVSAALVLAGDDDEQANSPGRLARHVASELVWATVNSVSKQSRSRVVYESGYQDLLRQLESVLILSPPQAAQIAMNPDEHLVAIDIQAEIRGQVAMYLHYSADVRRSSTAVLPERGLSPNHNLAPNASGLSSRPTETDSRVTSNPSPDFWGETVEAVPEVSSEYHELFNLIGPPPEVSGGFRSPIRPRLGGHR